MVLALFMSALLSSEFVLDDDEDHYDSICAMAHAPDTPHTIPFPRSLPLSSKPEASVLG